MNRVTRAVHIPAGSGDDRVRKLEGYISVSIESCRIVTGGYGWKVWNRLLSSSNDATLITEVNLGSPGLCGRSVHQLCKVPPFSDETSLSGRPLVVKLPIIGDSFDLSTKLIVKKNGVIRFLCESVESGDLKNVMEDIPVDLSRMTTVTRLIGKAVDAINGEYVLCASISATLSVGEDEENSEDDDSWSPGGALRTGIYAILYDEGGSLPDELVESEFAWNGNVLLYDGKRVECPYIVVSVKVDAYRGDDESAVWHRKFRDALSIANELYEDRSSLDRINYLSTRRWLECCTLLDQDTRYLSAEKDILKEKYRQQIRDQIKKISTSRGDARTHTLKREELKSCSGNEGEVVKNAGVLEEPTGEQRAMVEDYDDFFRPRERPPCEQVVAGRY